MHFSYFTNKQMFVLCSRRYEDNLAVIFMGIVIFFLVSHFPRIFLGLHEVFVSQQAKVTYKFLRQLCNK